MSLYGDLPTAREGAPLPASSSAAAPPYLTPRPGLAPRSMSWQQEPHQQHQQHPHQQPSRLGEAPGAEQTPAAAAPSRGSTQGSSAPRRDKEREEYDPAVPNDYEQSCQARDAQRKIAEMEAERQSALKALQDQQERQRVAAEQQRAAELSRSRQEAGARGDASAEAKEDPRASGLSFAAQMMQKMGWKQGQGLGKSQQGIVTPLVARKTDARSGVIVSAGLQQHLGSSDRRGGTGKAGDGATHVVLLRNMVGPGETDDDLEEEVGNECTKYGRVKQVVIFEVTEASFPPEEAVRIFIKFDTTAAAGRAVQDLEGRFFGGRRVRAEFFSEDRFARQELAPAERGQ